MMNCRSLARASVAMAGLMLLVAAPGDAFDLTGTWEGKANCAGLADGEKFRETFDLTAEISQSGRDVNARFGIPFKSGLTHGVAIPQAKNADKGEIGVVSCDTDFDPVFGMVGRAIVNTNPSKAKGTLRGSVIFTGKDVDELGITDGAISCRFNVKLVNTADPAVGDCFTP